MSRLDQWLVEKGLYTTRSRARDAISRATVFVDGKLTTKSSKIITSDNQVSIKDPAQKYVSRAALKLVAGLDAFQFDATDRLAIDLGASTGGFTQVLLERGAAHVFAIDVGEGQFASELRSNQRVSLLEKTNARNLGNEKKNLTSQGPLTAIVCDVSFISLKLALPPALALMSQDSWGLFLVKPQFEVGKKNIGKNGLVKDKTLAEKTAHDISHWLNEQSGWTSLGIVPSPISGADGNHEYLLGGMKTIL